MNEPTLVFAVEYLPSRPAAWPMALRLWIVPVAGGEVLVPCPHPHGGLMVARVKVISVRPAAYTLAGRAEYAGDLLLDATGHAHDGPKSGGPT